MPKRFTYIPPNVNKICKICNAKITKSEYGTYICENHCNAIPYGFPEKTYLEIIPGSSNSFYLGTTEENNIDLVEGDIQKIMTPFYELQTNIFLNTPNTAAEEEVIKKFWDEVNRNAPLPTIRDTWREMVYKFKKWFRRKK